MSYFASFYFESILGVLSKLFAIFDNITPPGIQVLEIQPRSSQPIPRLLVFIKKNSYACLCFECLPLSVALCAHIRGGPEGLL